MTTPSGTSAEPNYLDLPAFLREYAVKLAARDIGFEDNDLSMMLPHVAEELEQKDAEIVRLRNEHETLFKEGEEAMAFLHLLVEKWETRPEYVLKAIRTAISALKRAGVEWDDGRVAEPDVFVENAQLRGEVEEYRSHFQESIEALHQLAKAVRAGLWNEAARMANEADLRAVLGEE